MEMTFYDDSLRGGKSESGGGKSLKRPATLDLESPSTASKKQRFAILTTPDINMFKITTPEIERLIITNGALPTPTPTQILFPKDVTEEQENYAKGFEDALNKLHHQTGGEGERGVISGFLPIYLTTPTSVIKSSGNVSSVNIRPPSVDSSNSSCSNSNVSVPLEFCIKEELQQVPSDFSSPPLSPICKTPIDMQDQERIKLERKRYRNRIAASKCRRRKLEKIAQLEDKVKELKGENARLENTADVLREQVCHLKETVLDHLKKGCKILTHHL